MDRLQKKCFVASTGFHLLLLVILIVGPAFLVSKSQPDDMPILNFVPVMTSDDHVIGGGNPQATPPPPPPPPSHPQEQTPVPPQPVRPPEIEHHEERKPDPPKEQDKPVDKKHDPDSLEPAKETKRHLPNINTNLLTRIRDAQADEKALAEAKEAKEAKARELADERAAKNYRDALRHAAAAFGNAANSLQEGTAGTTTIKLAGPGGGGVPYANFLQAVKSVYEQAWIVPDGVTDDSATVAVSVTIARDGTVVSSHVVRGSGNSAVDQSVRVTLRRVTFAAPLPPNATESERTVTINFNVAAKRASG